MLIDFDNGQFICTCHFNERHVPKQAGFSWNNEIKRWTTTNVAIAQKLIHRATPIAKEKILDRYIKIDPLLGLDLELIMPRGFKLKGYQDTTTRFCLARSASYARLSPGLGKTIVSAVVKNTLGPKWACFYICPSGLTRNVIEEFMKWDAGQHLHVYSESMIFKLDTTDDLRRRVLDYRHNMKMKILLVIDEVHHYKTPDALRTKALFNGIKPLADRVLCLSGTPMNNRPIELYTVLSNCAPETIDFMSYYEYGMKYCAGYRDKYGMNFSGHSNMKELSARIKAKFMIRFDTKDVIDELPDVVEELLVVAEDMPAHVARMDKKLLEFFSPEDIAKRQIALNVSVVEQDGKQMHLATYRRELGKLKVPFAIEAVNQILEDSDDGLLVFAHHIEVMQGLIDGLKKHKPLVIRGGTSMADRHETVKLFQSSKDHRLLIANIIAGGIGHNITKANRVLFVEASYVPAEIEQCIARAARLGQEKPFVFAQFLVYRNSLDRSILEAVLRKRKVIDYV